METETIDFINERKNIRRTMRLRFRVIKCGNRNKKQSKEPIAKLGNGLSALTDKTRIFPKKSKDKFCHVKFLLRLLRPHQKNFKAVKKSVSA